MKSRVFSALAVFFALLLAFMIGGQAIVNGNRTYVNRLIGTTDSIIVSDDSMNFRSDFASPAELVEYHQSLGARISAEGSVLLQSGGALPLGDRNIALLGARAYDLIYGGKTGSTPKPNQNVTLEDALTQAGFTLDPAMRQYYAEHSPDKSVISTTFSSVTDKPVIGLYKVMEAECPTEAAMTPGFGTAVVVIGRQSTEAGSFYPGTAGMSKKANEFDEGTNVLGLAKNEKAEIAFAIEHYDNVVVLINSASAMEVPELSGSYAARAAELGKKLDVLWIGQPGNYGCVGVASVLSGQTAPSGKLTDIYVANGYSNPANANYGIIRFSDAEGDLGSTKNGWYEIWAEGIYTGYRYYETRYADTFSTDEAVRTAALAPTGVTTGGDHWSYADEVVYPFGFGLSTVPTKQVLNSAAVDMKGESVFNVTVTNNGNREVKDVVAIYAQSPFTAYDRENGVEKSAIQLLAFEKVTVPAGGSVTVDVRTDMEDLASYDAANAKTFILDYGDYYFSVGNGSHEALNNVLALQGVTGLTDHNGAPYAPENPARLAVKYTYSGEGAVDDKTWAVSRNGTPITNRLDNADYNHYVPGTVDYLSRTRWNFPVFYDGLPGLGVNHPEMTAGLGNHVYTVQTDGDTSSFVWSAENDAGLYSVKAEPGTLCDYDAPAWQDVVDSISLEDALHMIGGSANYVQFDAIDMGISWFADGPMGICDQSLSKRGSNTTVPDKAFYVDPASQEANYYLNTLPIQVVIAATFDHKIFEEVGRMMGNDGLWNGVRAMWAPGANLHRTPYNARNHEYASEDPVLTSWVVDVICRSALRYGMVMAPKHYAFNATENNRYGIAEFFNEQSAREGELRGFRRAFEQKHALATMTAFNRVGPVYSSAHKGLITDILRTEWGMSGLVVTDLVATANIFYMNVRDSVAAGTDIMLAEDSFRTPDGAWYEFTPEGLKGDPFLMTQVKNAVHHVVYSVANSATPAGKVVHLDTWYDQAFRWSIVGSAALCAVCFLLSICLGGKRKEG